MTRKPAGKAPNTALGLLVVFQSHSPKLGAYSNSFNPISTLFKGVYTMYLRAQERICVETEKLLKRSTGVDQRRVRYVIPNQLTTSTTRKTIPPRLEFPEIAQVTTDARTAGTKNLVTST